MSVTVTVLFPTKPEAADEFYTNLVGLLTETRAYDGCIKVSTHRDLDNSANIFLIEEWESREHQQKYLAWRVETGLMDAIGPALAGPPTVSAYSNPGD